MYHTRHKGTHYEAGYKWGNLLFHNGNIIGKRINKGKYYFQFS